jgi:hypothetical protein
MVDFSCPRTKAVALQTQFFTKRRHISAFLHRSWYNPNTSSDHMWCDNPIASVFQL